MRQAFLTLRTVLTRAYGTAMCKIRGHRYEPYFSPVGWKGVKRCTQGHHFNPMEEWKEYDKSCLFPCGCVMFSNRKPLFINGTDVSNMVTTVEDFEFCEKHKESLARTLASMHDQMIEDVLFKYDGEYDPAIPHGARCHLEQFDPPSGSHTHSLSSPTIPS